MPINIERFLEQGYDIVPADRPDVLVAMREEIFEKAKDMVAYKGEALEEFFNKFHQYNLRGSALNEKRVQIVRYFTEHLNTGQNIYDAFSDTLLRLIGPDIVAQKITNLVIQQPGDIDQTPTHRDAPLNSPFEIVIWLPLVDVYRTKGLHVLNLNKSRQALDLLEDADLGYEKFRLFAQQEGTQLNIPFGHACFFWTGLVHGCDVNKEDETRWSLNFRYKNLFSPVGSKGLGEFFNLLQLSPLARLALEYEKAHSQEYRQAQPT
jgi:sporadic carbohydrate cluster 2OG-Fe(II) oxygenase